MKLTPLPAFTDNYIWLLETSQGQAWVVDPGEAGPVLEALRLRHLELAGLLITHHHPDHTGGIHELTRTRSVPVYGPAEGISGLTQLVAGGETLDLPVIGKVQIIAVPGHTSGHIAYYVEQHGILFCGDTLFSSGCGRLFEGTAEQMYRSLEALNKLPANTLVCCAHEYTLSNLRFALAVEPENAAIMARVENVMRLRERQQPSVPSLLGEERTWNPFLRCTNQRVVEAASEQEGRELSPGAATFAVLRSWKDNFRG